MEFSSSALGEWQFPLGGWDGDRHWEVSGAESGEAILDPVSFGVGGRRLGEVKGEVGAQESSGRVPATDSPC